MSEQPETDSQQRPPAALVAVAILIAAPIVALMWVSSYARETPRLWGMPFFYWYQFLWVFLAAGCTYAAYRIVLATSPRRREPGPAGPRTADERRQP
jgi:membrane protein implicated in regulation of membrane protease activity